MPKHTHTYMGVFYTNDNKLYTESSPVGIITKQYGRNKELFSFFWLHKVVLNENTIKCI